MLKSTHQREVELFNRCYERERDLWEKRMDAAEATIRDLAKPQLEIAPQLTGANLVAMALQELDDAKQRAAAKPPRHIRTIFNSLSRRDRMLLIEAAREVKRHADANYRIANGVEVIRRLWEMEWPQQD